MIAAHCSGLSDAGGYLHAGPVRDWPMVWGAAPGEAFDYCNLGYVLLAEMAERLTGTPFGVLAARELDRIGVVGGFNWWGVPDVPVLPTFRRDGGRLVAQVDAPRVAGAGFSPQGGCGCPCAGCSGSRGRWAGGWRADLGRAGAGRRGLGRLRMGVQFLDRPVLWPRPVMGHFGNAYGFVGGAWRDRETGVAFAVALNGLEVGDEDDGFRAEERGLYEEVRRVVEAGRGA